MKKKAATALVSIHSLFFLFLSCIPANGKKESSIPDLFPSAPGCELAHHTAYTLCYSEKDEQAKWVAYHLTKNMCELNAVKRKDKFIPDPLVETGSATSDDYKNSGYDRGHLCPAGDMNWSERSMEESFYMSNISPQLHEFNAGIWERLEKKVRDWAEKKGEVFVVDGGVLRDGLPVIGNKNKISVPEYFYKIVFAGTEEHPSVIAFVIANKAWVKKSFFDFTVPVDSIERMTGIDFFPQLSDSVENALECKVNTSGWMN